MHADPHIWALSWLKSSNHGSKGEVTGVKKLPWGGRTIEWGPGSYLSSEHFLQFSFILHLQQTTSKITWRSYSRQPNQQRSISKELPSKLSCGTPKPFPDPWCYHALVINNQLEKQKHSIREKVSTLSLSQLCVILCSPIKGIKGFHEDSTRFLRDISKKHEQVKRCIVLRMGSLHKGETFSPEMLYIDS